MKILIILLLFNVILIAQGDEDVNNTMNYFKAVGIEIAKLLCNNLDLILESLNENDGNS